MAMWGRAEPKNHNPTLYIYRFISPSPFIGCLSRPYLGTYKRNWNETWFIDRWQWETGQCKIIIILPCCLQCFSPLPFIRFIMNACPGHILESTNVIEMQWFIDRCQWEKVQCTRIITMSCILTVLLPFTI